MLESGELCIHSARVTGIAATNDYSKTIIRLILTEKHVGVRIGTAAESTLSER